MFEMSPSNHSGSSHTHSWPEATWVVCSPQLLSTMVQGSAPDDLSEGVLVVIAHPDDETMFFSPLLTWASLNEKVVHILCLTGDEIRRKELMAACSTVHQINSHNIHFSKNSFIDTQSIESGGMWSHQDVVNEVVAVLDDVNVACVITFDDYGVSGHPNHRSICRALKSPQGSAELASRVQLWTLDSQSMVIKYLLGFLTFMYLRYCHMDKPKDALSHVCYRRYGDDSDYLVVEYPAMSHMAEGMRCHQSQLVWYRWLWIVFSIYNCTNEFSRHHYSMKNKKDD
eukprot:GHVH01000987.1.p1 GENE.GHVH01000987.1~~GHVH01000987.1.p1  ORF type:complete len:284 (-),score=45.41 GHVH01000987.1:378-1229(-)